SQQSHSQAISQWPAEQVGGHRTYSCAGSQRGYFEVRGRIGAGTRLPASAPPTRFVSQLPAALARVNSAANSGSPRASDRLGKRDLLWIGRVAAGRPVAHLP